MKDKIESGRAYSSNNEGKFSGVWKAIKARFGKRNLAEDPYEPQQPRRSWVLSDSYFEGKTLFGEDEIIDQEINELAYKVRDIGSGGMSSSQVTELRSTLERDKDKLSAGLRNRSAFNGTSKVLTDLLYAKSYRDDEYKEVQTFAVNIVDQNIDYLQNNFESSTASESKRLMWLAEQLVHKGSKEQKERGINFILKNYSTARDKALKMYQADPNFSLPLVEMRSDYKGVYSRDVAWFGRIVYAILENGTESQIEEATRLASNFFESEDRQIRSIGTEAISNYLVRLGFRFKESSIQTRVKSVMERCLTAIGIDMPIMDGWKIATSAERYWEYAADNLNVIFELESIEPGICKTLNSKFGIVNFSRYPQSLLIDQYKEINDQKKQYGIILYPYSDPGGDFNGDTWTYTQLHRTLKNLGYGIRVAESGSKVDALKKLYALRRQYGKASFGILGGHGTASSIRLGPNLNQSLSLGDLGASADDSLIKQVDLDSRHAIKASDLIFKEGAVCILASCSTGQDKGIAEKMSRLGISVIAPDVSTNFGYIDVKRTEDGLLDFNVNYKEGKTRVFKAA